MFASLFAWSLINNVRADAALPHKIVIAAAPAAWNPWRLALGSDDPRRSGAFEAPHILRIASAGG
jgi:hypothetical protein